MTAADTLELAAEARTQRKWLRCRRLDLWVSPFEVEQSIINGETHFVAMPLELASLSELASSSMPSRQRRAAKCRKPQVDPFELFYLDVLVVVVVIAVVGFYANWIMGERGQSMFDQVLAGWLR